MKKSVDSRRADDEENLLAKKRKKKSVLADQTESMNGSKKKTMTTKKKSASFEGGYEEECAVKKTKKKSSLRGIKLKKVSVEIGRKDVEVQLGIKKVKTKQKKCSAKMESVGEEPAKKKKKKKKLSKVSEEVTAKKKMKKRSSADCEEVSDEVEESAKKKKKKISLDKIEEEEEEEGHSTSVAELKKKKKTSHIVKELPNKKTKKRKESFLAKIEACETPSEISKPRKKKKKKKKSSESSEANERVVNAAKKRSMAQREMLEPIEEESVEKKKKKNGGIRKEELITKKRKKSSFVLTEPQETCLEIGGMREEESLIAEEPAELLGEMEELNSEEESSEDKTKESYSTDSESLDSPEAVEGSYQGRTDSPPRTLVVPEVWSQAVASIVYDSTTSLAPVTVVCGAKNSGKSTFCRFLLNNIIQRYGKVAYLETDVGQAEFTPPVLSELGLGFVLLTRGFLTSLSFPFCPAFADLSDQCLEMPERWFFYGDISSKRDPNAYLKYVRSLYDYFHSEYYILNERGIQKRSQLPLVVNTPGWVKVCIVGIGYDMLVEMLKYIAPTHVVQIRVPIDCKNLPAGPFWLNEDEEEPNLFKIDAVYRDHSGRWTKSGNNGLELDKVYGNGLSRQKDSKFMREKKIFHYFRQCFPTCLNISSWKDLAHALASLPPYEVPLSSVQIRHLHCQVPSTEVLHSLNATIVGLAVSSAESSDLELCTPSCVGLELLGLIMFWNLTLFFNVWSNEPGIVRGIDVSKGLIYVLTPVPPSNLKNVDLLLQGYVQIPTYLLQFSGVSSGGLEMERRQFAEFGKLIGVLIYAVLEWILIIVLFINGLISFAANEFARLFGLEPPCLFCTRIHRYIVRKDPDFCYNDSICEAHKKDLSPLVYCKVHRRLSNAQRICEGCLLSFAIEGKSTGDVVKSLVGVLRLQGGVEENLEKVEQHGCCCCGESLGDVTSCFANVADAAKTLILEDVPRSPPTCPSEIPLKENEKLVDIVPLPHIQYTELKLMSDAESEVPEEEDGSITPIPDAKAVTVPLLMECDESNEEICKIPGLARMKLPRVSSADSLKASSGEPPGFPKALLVESPALLSMDGMESNGGSEADGNAMLHRLERRVELDKKSLVALYKELDEERSASAIAANQAMAMITRLQAEKAAVQMEALQYQRMMEEQAEFDQRALQFLKDLLMKREEEIKVLEAELESYEEKTVQCEEVDMEKCKAWADAQYRKLTSGRSAAAISEKSDCDDDQMYMRSRASMGAVEHLSDLSIPEEQEQLALSVQK
ncbi:hypothetical protein Scep_017637 [Stephania cephalantha]|uniref:GTD-binding domain-containing protein n=1 Tax=Stephania cephalantha TaxID=152367 RepID=A0AAP0NV49_9MAGN